MTPKPVLAVTLGDPAGIGPEVALKSLSEKKIYQVCRPLAVGDAQFLSLSNHHSGLKIRPILNPAQAKYHFGTVDVLHVPCGNFSGIAPGTPSKASGENSLLCVQKSIELAAARLAQGVVHAPISKLAWKMAGARHSGHTELISEMCGVAKFAMAIASGPIRTVMVTRHVPLSKVPGSLRKEGIVQAIELACQWMKKLKVRNPRIGVCALNPHAGEKGLIGTEEISVIGPAVKAAQKKMGCKVTGPLPADSAYRDHKRGFFDCLITMYHDQSLIPVKLHDADKIVNLTLGLPFARTSPGHGTAFDIAGKNRANPSPMKEAIFTCAKLCS